MSKKKILIIWSSVSLVLLACVFVTVNLIMTWLANMMAPQYQRYGQKIGPVIYNLDHSTAEEIEQLLSRLKLRSLLSDTTLKNEIDESGDFLTNIMGDFTFTYTHLFVCEDKEIPDIAYGCWANVYRNDPSKLESDDRLTRMELKASFAMFDFEKAINQGYGLELQTAVKEDQNVSIRIDQYAINGLELIPMHITVLKDDQIVKEYFPNAANEIPSGFKIVEEEEVWAYNRKYQSFTAGFVDIDLSNIKEIKRLRAIAMKTASKIDFQNPDLNMPEYDMYEKVSTNPFSSTTISYGIVPTETGNSPYSLVLVFSTNNTGMTLIFSALTLGFWTILFGIIVFAFRKRK